MNKFKKTAVAITSVVMAGAMVFSFTGCGGGGGSSSGNAAIGGGSWDASPSSGANAMVTLLNGKGLSTRTIANAAGWETASSYWDYLKEHTSEVSATGTSLTYTNGTSIKIAIQHNSYATGAFYSTGQTDSITTEVNLPGGYTARAGGIKPAFAALQTQLNITFENACTSKSTSANLADLYTNNKWNVQGGVDICTSDLSVATSSTYSSTVLNLADYLDQMPNFKAFLEENPVVYLSLLQDGMSTSDGSGKSILVAPYFDGNDDIERYCLIRQDWVEDLLDDTLSYEGDTVKDACGITETSATGYMGTSGTYTVETSKEDGSGDTFTLKKDYDAAKSAASDSTTDLGGAYYAITGEAYTGDSGNIVDIMNAAINAQAGEVTGKQLATLYRAYIDVAYSNDDTDTRAYATRSDVFNGYSAAWDVDDLVAMLRIVKTNSRNVGLESCSTAGIFPRSSNNDRTPDMVRLAAQLYGERGADSRYEYTYIDSDGELKDARQNATFYQALENFGTLAAEGLVEQYVLSSGSSIVSTSNWDETGLKGDCDTKAGYGFMEYDYSQTQTKQMFDLDEDSVDSDYLFAAISTPVSRWDDNGDGVKDTIMRFTESWRSTKTGGLVVAANVKNDINKLNAILTFIDYLYSNDGQIISTYGAQDTTENSSSPNGTWYGNKVSGTTVSGNNLLLNGNIVATKVGGQFVVTDEYESEYFCFGNELYTGTLYKGKTTPTVTDEMFAAYTAKSTDSTWGAVTSTFNARGSFTDFARKVLGSTLPMGVKDQSLENQLTAKAAAAEATKVSVSLANGTIKHVYLTIQDNPWYTTVPTGLPLTSDQSSTIDSTTQADLKYMTGTVKDDKNFYSIFHYIIFFGYTGTYYQQGVTVQFS